MKQLSLSEVMLPLVVASKLADKTPEEYLPGVDPNAVLLIRREQDGACATYVVLPDEDGEPHALTIEDYHRGVAEGWIRAVA